jgi:hypothetical protein
MPHRADRIGAEPNRVRRMRRKEISMRGMTKEMATLQHALRSATKGIAEVATSGMEKLVGEAKTWTPTGEDLTCRCGHAHHLHEHYRNGTDCSQCECIRFSCHPLDLVTHHHVERAKPVVALHLVRNDDDDNDDDDGSRSSISRPQVRGITRSMS